MIFLDKKNKSNHKKYNKEIIGIITIFFGILSVISLFSNKTGIIGAFLKNLYFTLMGFGGYFFPWIIIIIGVLFITNKFNINKHIKSIYLLVIFSCFLTFLDIANQNTAIFTIKIKQAMDLSQKGFGGGVIGTVFGYFFYKLFGSLGSYIILLFIAFIFTLLFTEVNVLDSLKNIKYKFKNINEKTTKDKNNNLLLKKNKNNKDIIFRDYINEKKENKDILENKKIEHKDDTKNNYILPTVDLLNTHEIVNDSNNKKNILNNAKQIEETMKNFDIDARISQINKGPTVTCYELQPAPGVKVSRILGLYDDLSLSLATSDIRIEAPIPGKPAVGIEVPNKNKDNVSLKEILQSDEYINSTSKVPLLLGKNISGKPIVSSINKMPHLLIAGATGSGKSVCINSIIMSIIFKSSADEVRFILIDPKVVELSVYNGIPHLLIPVVTEPKKATSALSWAVKEMERRYKLFAKNNVRDIKSYNNKFKNTEKQKLPDIVIIIDELADLMMVAAQEIEDYICRLAQMARAAGIYLIVATQRPSVDVITGIIKANIPSRISFSVSSQVDSRTILDMSGAEKLLGKGDMLFYPSSFPKPIRIQGAFVTDKEIENVVNNIKEQNIADYDKEVLESIKNEVELEGIMEDLDELFPDAVRLVLEEGQASISLLQRRLKIGYARAARIIDSMEDRNIIGGFEGSKPRKVLITKSEVGSLFKERF